MFVERHVPAPLPIQCTADASTKVAILKSTSHQRMCGLLDQLALFFQQTHQLFSDLSLEASTTHNRLKNLRERVKTVSKKVSLVEKKCTGTPYKERITYERIGFESKAKEDQMLFTTDQRPGSITAQIETCFPVPSLNILDEFADGNNCLKNYTNPDFFIEQWIEEEQRKYEEAKKKRIERRKQRRKDKDLANKQTTRKVVAQVELRRTKYSAMGQEFANSPAKNSPAVASAVTLPVSVQEKDSVKRAGSQPPPASSAAPTAPPPPTPSAVAASSSEDTPRAGEEEEARKRKSTLGSAGSKKVDAVKKEEKEKKEAAKKEEKKRKEAEKVEKKNRRKTAMLGKKGEGEAPPPVDITSLPPPALPGMPPPSTPAPPPPPPSAPPSSVPPISPPPPPPANLAPPPPPPSMPSLKPAEASGGPAGGSSLASALAGGTSMLKKTEVEEKPKDARSSLLASIHTGVALKRTVVEENKKQPEEKAGAAGAFNVAKILARRAAMEFSDDEDDVGEEEQWDD